MAREFSVHGDPEKVPVEENRTQRMAATADPSREHAPTESGANRLREVATSANEEQEMIEQTIWQGSYSPLDMVDEWIVLGVVLIGVTLLVVLVPALLPFWPVAVALIGIALVVELVRVALRRLQVRYRLTTHRFIHEKGLLRRQTDRVEVIDIEDVSVVQSLTDRLTDVGTLKIRSSDPTHSELAVPGIRNVKTVANQVDSARRRELLRRGVHINN